MRSLWLASAAVIISAGVACAQTAGPATPAGPTTATPLTDSGSSGTTATPPPAANSTTMAPMGTDTGQTTAKPLTDSGSSGSASTPPTTGTAMTPPASTPAPDMAPATPVASTATPMAVHHHHMMMGMAMPANGGAADYLHYAKGAIKHHDKMGADNALAMAETRLLNRSVPQGQIAADDSPAISSIETARKAVDMGDMMKASAAVDMAISQANGGMSMSAPASQPAPGSGMSAAGTPPLGTKSVGQMGGAPMANETSDSAAAGGATHLGAAPASSPATP
jgi:hypothetical protein